MRTVFCCPLNCLTCCFAFTSWFTEEPWWIKLIGRQLANWYQKIHFDKLQLKEFWSFTWWLCGHKEKLPPPSYTLWEFMRLESRSAGRQYVLPTAQQPWHKCGHPGRPVSGRPVTGRDDGHPLPRFLIVSGLLFMCGGSSRKLYNKADLWPPAEIDLALFSPPCPALPVASYWLAWFFALVPGYWLWLDPSGLSAYGSND